MTEKTTAKPRRPISKKIRFEVFKRDGFTCAYCGAHPPAAILQIDHIDPVANGGSNAIDNLITACEGCNQGKSHRLLSEVPESLKDRAKLIKEKEMQLSEYRALVARRKSREAEDTESIERIFKSRFPGYEFSSKFRDDVRLSFLKNLDAETMQEHMEIACNRMDEPDRAIRYFCGINWRVIKEQGYES
jgi:hypothetical protein